ncbi:MAG: PqqD family protein [Eubacteriales bacterium]|nr:PqqD family protein [Eubacteriales bacterium]
MKIEKSFVLREIAGEYIIVPTGNTALDFNGLITVNEVGMFLWNLLQSEVTVEDLIRKTMEEYEVDRETVKGDIEEFLEKLKTNGILN